MKIFISHSSKDKLIIDSFVEKILILGCSINEKDIFCTSIEGLGIKNGLDFREHIKTKLLSSDYSFLLISNNYKESDICLNEMGASWAQETVKVKPFIFPDINFESIGTLYSVKQVSKLNDSTSLDELYEELTSQYGTIKKIARWNKNKNDFLKILEGSKNEIKKEDVSHYKFFEQFLHKNTSFNLLLQKCHPNLIDCKKIFRKEYFQKYFESYCKLFYDNRLVHDVRNLSDKYKHYRVTKIGLFDSDKLTGGMNEIIEKGVINFDAVFYKVEFLEYKDSEFGLAYDYFCYLDNRWVFLHKPWRYYE